MEERQSRAPDSMVVAFSETARVSEIVSMLHGEFGDALRSARVSIRGPRSRTVELLEALGERVADVSSVVTLRGDTPAA